MGAIHGRLLTAWSAAGIAGPLIVNSILDAREAAGVEGADKYVTSMFVMVGLLIVGFVANLLVRPAPEKFHEPADATPSTPPEHTPMAAATDGTAAASAFAKRDKEV